MARDNSIIVFALIALAIYSSQDSPASVELTTDDFDAATQTKNILVAFHSPG